jgi:hypothetical protein
MGLETVNNGKIHELNDDNPTASDSVNRGDDHIRNIKKVIKETFSGINDEGANAVPVTAESAELNILDGATLTTDELNILDGVTATAAEINVLDGISEDLEAADLNILDGVTATTTELNYVDGVTSAIQDQIDDKQDTLTAGNNVTIDAVTENNVTTTTITASGTPFVVVGDDTGNVTGTNSGDLTKNQWNNVPVTQIVYPSNTMSGSPAVPTGVSINASGDTLTLPEGTYYYEAWAKVANKSYTDSIGDLRVQLHRGGTAVGYSHNSQLWEHDTHTFPNQGMFTVAAGGQDIRLKIYRASDDAEAVYGAHDSGVAAGMQSLIKVWKL